MLVASVTAALILGFGGASSPAVKPAPKVNAYAVVKGPSGLTQAPLFDPAFATVPIARVEGEAIQLAELTEALNAMHQDTSAGSKRAKKDFRPIVDRLIGTRLVALEAVEMGLAELPEVKEALDKFQRGALRDFVKHRASQNLKVDKLLLEQLYAENTREFRLRSVVFEKAEDANAFAFAVREGGDFAALAKKAQDQKKAKVEPVSDFVPRKQMLPELLAALAGIGKGKITSPVAVTSGTAVLFVEDVRQADDRIVRMEIEAELLEREKEAALDRQAKALEKKYAKVDQKLVDSLDFEAAKPGFEAMMKDERVVATIGTASKITVGELAKEIRQGFFHGMDAPIREKRVNVKKEESLRAVIKRHVYDAEAAALKIAESDDYKRAVLSYRNSRLFGLFVQRALLPGIEVKEKETRSHYDAHKAEYGYPAFYRLHSLAFLDAKAASDAAAKLKSGTDLKWLRANADRQVPEEKRRFELDGRVLTTSGLTPALAKTLKGARTGDIRQHREGDQYFVLFVQEVTPPKPRPYLEVREEIARKLHADKVNAALDEWIAKMRSARKVEVLITQLSSNK